MRGLLGHGTWAIAGTVIDAVGSAVMSALLTRLLGVRSMGQYGYTQTFASFVLMFTALGVPAFVSQRVAESSGRGEKPDRYLLVGAWYMVVIAWPLAAAATTAWLLAGGLEAAPGILAAGLASAIGVSLLGLAVSVARSLGRFDAAFSASVSARLTSIIAVAIVAWSGGGVAHFMGGYAAIQWLAAVTLLLTCMPPKRWRASWRPQGQERAWIRQALPFGVLILFEATMFRVDTLLVEWLRGGVETGYYVTAFTVYTMPLLLSYSVTTAFYPWFTRAHAAGVGVGKVASNLNVAVAGYGVLAGVGLWLLGPWLLELAFGEATQRAGPVLKVLALALPAAGLSRMGLAALKGTGRIRAAAIASAVSLLVAVGGNLLLTTRGGPEAAAWVNLWTELALLTCVVALGGLSAGRRHRER